MCVYCAVSLSEFYKYICVKFVSKTDVFKVNTSRYTPIICWATRSDLKLRSKTKVIQYTFTILHVNLFPYFCDMRIKFHSLKNHRFV